MLFLPSLVKYSLQRIVYLVQECIKYGLGDHRMHGQKERKRKYTDLVNSFLSHITDLIDKSFIEGVALLVGLGDGT